MSKRGKKKEEELLVIPKPKVQGLHSILKFNMFEYGSFVINERSTPRITDGLMTVERRVIYGMHNEGITHNKPFRKSARSVGVVMGSFHPHGDSSIYGSMMKMSQDWKMNITYVEPSGSNGNITGDKPAAMRYVEARLHKYSTLLTDDLKYKTVAMINTYDDENMEPIELPARVPNLLINGSQGIGVGFASKILPHNYHDSIEVCRAFNKNRDMTIDEMIDIIKAPDFPSGGIINGLGRIREAYKSSSGSCLVRGIIDKHFDEKKKAWNIDTTTLPPSTDHVGYVTKLQKLVEDGQIKVREKVVDLTNRYGVRIRLALHKSEDPNRVENLLYKKAGLQASSNMTLFALIDGVPRNVTLYDMVAEFIKFRERIVYNRSMFKLDKALEDLHIQKGLVIAYKNIDEIIKVIRKSKKDIDALEKLVKKFKLSERQASYILDLKIRKLTSLESAAVDEKIKNLDKEINVLQTITKSRSNKHITKIIDEELEEAYKMVPNNGRKCKIIANAKEVNVLDAIKDEPRTMVLTRNGRLKNMDIKLDSQGRLGTGSSFLTSTDDEPEIIISTSTTSTVFCFTNTGKVYAINPYKIEISSKTSRGKLAKTELGLRDNEFIIYMKSMPKDFDSKGKYLVFFTESGLIKVTSYKEYESITASGKKGIKLISGDKLVNVCLWDKKENADAMITTESGYSLRLGLDNITPTGRDTSGVRGIKLKDKKDKVVGGIIIESELIYFINKTGQIKKVEASEFSKKSRGGFGMISGSDIVGTLSDSRDYDKISIFTKLGMSISIDKDTIRKVKRTSAGVGSIKLGKGDAVIKMFES